MLQLVALPLTLLLFNIDTFVTTNQAVLLFPKNTVFQFTIGVAVPIVTNKRGTLSFTVGYQFNYGLPWNLTQLQTTTIIPARDNNDLYLQNVYQSIESLLNKYGWSNGRQCLLRSICEIAETPLGRIGPDVVEEIIHLLLTPTEDLPEAVNSSHRSVDKLYQEAEQLGRSGGDCILTYPDCIESPLELFTNIVYP